MLSFIFALRWEITKLEKERTFGLVILSLPECQERSNFLKEKRAVTLYLTVQLKYALSHDDKQQVLGEQQSECETGVILLYFY